VRAAPQQTFAVVGEVKFQKLSPHNVFAVRRGTRLNLASHTPVLQPWLTPLFTAQFTRATVLGL